MILVGDAGVGKRTLAHALGLLMAEGKGPADLAHLVEVSETALLDDADEAFEAGLRQARDGILLIPNVERFFGGSTASPEFPKARDRAAGVPGHERPSSLPRPPMRPGTTGWPTTQLSASTATGCACRSPASTKRAPILAVHKSHLEHDYHVQIADEALPAAVKMAKRYVVGMALPASGLAVLHRACAMLKLAGQSQSAFRPDCHRTPSWTRTTWPWQSAP